MGFKKHQPWKYIAEAPILWPSDAKSQLIEKDPDAEKNQGQEGKGETEDEMVGWHHWLNGGEFEQTLGDNEGQETKSWTWLQDWTTTRAKKPWKARLKELEKLMKKVTWDQIRGAQALHTPWSCQPSPSHLNPGYKTSHHILLGGEA